MGQNFLNLLDDPSVIKVDLSENQDQTECYSSSEPNLKEKMTSAGKTQSPKIYEKTICIFLRVLNWRYWQDHTRQILRKLDLPSHQNINLKIFTYTSLKNVDHAKFWYESIVDRHQNRVDLYLDTNKILYDVVGFNFNIVMSHAINPIQLIKQHYVQFYVDLDKKDKNWESQPLTASSNIVGSKGVNPAVDENFLVKKFMDTGEENICLQGGDVVLNRQGIIEKVFVMQSFRDRVSMADLGL